MGAVFVCLVNFFSSIVFTKIYSIPIKIGQSLD